MNRNRDFQAVPARSPPTPTDTPACPLCNGASTYRFTSHNHPIFECLQCGHRFCSVDSAGHVARIYDDEYFFGGGAGYDDYLSEQSMLESSGRRYARLISRFRHPGRVLDIGAASGFFLKAFVDAGWTGQGIEPNPTMSQWARERFGLEICTTSIEEFVPPNRLIWR